MPQQPSDKLLQSLRELRDQGIPFLPVARIKPWADNPNVHQPGVPALVRSMQRFGWTIPVLVRREDLEASAGHGRLIAAAEELGLDEVPVIYRGFTAEESHAYALADNKIPEHSREDDAKLAKAIDDLVAAGEREAVLDAGFDDKELAKLEKMLNPPAPPEDDGEGGQLTRPVIQYAIVFDDEAQQEAWYGFLRYLKQHVEGETHAARIVGFIGDHRA